MTYTERVNCPECGCRVTASVPRNGDGSRLRIRTHYITTMRTKPRCGGSGSLVRGGEESVVSKRIEKEKP